MMNPASAIEALRKSLPDLVKHVSEELLELTGDAKMNAMNGYRRRSVAIIMRSCLKTISEIIMTKNESTGDDDSKHGSSSNAEYFKEEINELDVMIEFIWEQLNTGHWKEVSVVWRKLYSFASLFKAILLLQSEARTSEAIAVCDLGLLMGAPIADNILSKIAFNLHLLLESVGNEEISNVDDANNVRITEGIIRSAEFNLHSRSVLSNQFPGYFEIDLVSRPSIENFVQEFFLPKKPVVIRDSISHWPALRKWDVEYIKKRTGSRTVPIEIGSKYTSEEWTQKLVTMRDFIDIYILSSPDDSRNKGYLAQHQLFHQIPELLQDLSIPEYCYVGTDQDVEINAWFGPAGTISPTHYDPKHNLLTQIFGRKIIRLFPWSEWQKLYPHDEESMLFNTSQIDIEDTDLPTKFPNTLQAKYTDVLLEPGMMLYMPPKWAHFVKSLSPSFSVSYWFQ